MSVSGDKQRIFSFFIAMVEQEYNSIHVNIVLVELQVISARRQIVRTSSVLLQGEREGGKEGGGQVGGDRVSTVQREVE